MSMKRRQELIDEYPTRRAQSLADQGEDDEPALAAQPDYYCPRMPITHDVQEHGEKLQDSTFPFNAAVARTVNKRELGGNPEARAAVQLEWDKIRSTKC